MVFCLKTLPILCPRRVSSLVSTRGNWLNISSAGTPNDDTKISDLSVLNVAEVKTLDNFSITFKNVLSLTFS